MPLNFPNSPTANQVFTDSGTGNRYIWDASRNLWRYTANSFSSVAIQTSAPGSPLPGALWWDSNAGRMYIYYNDGDSGQWVEASPSGPAIDVSLITSYTTPIFTSSNTKLTNSTVTLAGTLTATGAVIDSKGDTRDVPSNDRSSSMPYTITISDTGKMVLANGNTNSTANVFIPNNVFFTGNTLMITNISTNTVTITQNSGVTMFLAGTTTTGNRSLASKGIATLMCVSANNFIISGAGLT